MTDFNIGFVIFPMITQLDFTGPLQVLNRVPGAKTHIVAKTLDPVPTDCGLGLMPSVTYDDCPDLDMICIPGGLGVENAIHDEDTIDFVRRQAAHARYVTSVCTGTFVLGAAGLLRNKKATTHWAYTDLLPMFGATYQKGRVVKDGKLVTAGGVSSGIDFGLEIARDIAGDEAAQSIQLMIEYDPAPPFRSGHPDLATDAVRQLASPKMGAMNSSLKARIDALQANASA